MYTIEVVISLNWQICFRFLFLIIELLILDTRFILWKDVTKREVPNLVIASQNGMLTIPHGFFKFWQYLSSNFEKKSFLFWKKVSQWIDGKKTITFSWRRPLSYRKQSIGLCHERVKVTFVFRSLYKKVYNRM